MWVLLAFVSAFFLGFYDIAKKRSLQNNAVLTVLFLNTVFCSLIFLPFILLSSFGRPLVENTIFDASLEAIQQGEGSLALMPAKAHLLVVLKSIIVLISWILGYFSLKHLPLTIAAPINATRPVLILAGAVLLFAERLNVYQWAGVTLSFISLLLMSRSGKKEGIDFSKNKWIFLLFGTVITGAISGLYDKYIMKQLPALFVQSWFNIYQVCIMGGVLLVFGGYKKKFEWRWSILCISLFISIADFAYFYSLSYPQSMISMVSMIRRGSVIVAFVYGAFILKDKNIKSKAIDLVFILIGLLLLCIGSSLQ